MKVGCCDRRAIQSHAPHVAQVNPLLSGGNTTEPHGLNECTTQVAQWQYAVRARGKSGCSGRAGVAPGPV